MKEGRDYLIYLEDMLEAMERILEYTESMSFYEFKESNLVRDAVIRNLEIVGEAANNIPDNVKQNYQEIPWRQMYGLRNLIAHKYFGIDYENIWKIIADELPDNAHDLEKVINPDYSRNSLNPKLSR